jgi:hypothetical protein
VLALQLGQVCVETTSLLKREAVAPAIPRGTDHKLKNWRGIATRDCKTARTYLGGITLAAALIWEQISGIATRALVEYTSPALETDSEHQRSSTRELRGPEGATASAGRTFAAQVATAARHRRAHRCTSDQASGRLAGLTVVARACARRAVVHGERPRSR